MTNLKAGDTIPSVEEMEKLPVGTAVTKNGDTKLATRHDGGWQDHRNMGQFLPASHYWYEGIQIVSLPGYLGPTTGERITRIEQIVAVPDGTVLVNVAEPAHRIDSPFEGREERRWRDLYSGGSLTDQELAERATTDNPFEVESLPVDLFETAEQFAWRFRDLAITGAERALNRASHAIEILDKIGVEFQPSVGMRVTNAHDRASLKKGGTRVYVGDPENPAEFALFEHNGGTWEKVFGEGERTPDTAVAVVIDAIDGKTEPDEWFVKAPTEEDVAEVARLRSRAWKLGFQSKTAKGWCNEFERVMLRGGITEDSARLPLPGGATLNGEVTVEQARAQQIGSYFKVMDGNKVTAIFVRSNKSKNKAGTRRVWASEAWSGGHFADRMTLVSTPDEVGRFGVARLGSLGMGSWVTELTSLPVGTRIRPNGSRDVFQKVEPQRGYNWSYIGSEPFAPESAAERNVSYSDGSFGANYHYLRIGAPE